MKTIISSISPKELVTDQSIGEYIRHIVEKIPERPAMAMQKKIWTYREIWETSGRLAFFLLSKGIRHGTHVALLGEDRPETVLCLLALLRIGAVCIMLSTLLPDSELERRMAVTDTKILLTDDGESKLSVSADEIERKYPHWASVLFFGHKARHGMLPIWDSLPQTVDPVHLKTTEKQVRPRDTDLLLFTSGTVSTPKAVITSHFSRLNSARMQAMAIQSGPWDRYLVVLPIYHCFSLTANVLSALCSGACLQFIPDRHTSTILNTIEQEHCTVFSSVPTMFSAILKKPNLNEYDLTSLRTGLIGGAPYPESLFQEICERLGLTLLSSLGQTEATAGITASSLSDDLAVRSRTIGTLFPNLSGIVIDPVTGSEVPNGILGELCIKGYTVMQGYYKSPVETEKQFLPGGWLRTGDLVKVDSGGNYVYCGRSKEIIIRGGEKISPVAVESVIGRHQNVRMIKVIGVPDPHYGEEICALIVTSHPVRESEIRALIRGQLEPFCVPKYLFFVDNLPLTQSGKPDTEKCREVALKRIQDNPVSE